MPIVAPNDQRTAADRAREEGDKNPKPDPKEELSRLEQQRSDLDKQIHELKRKTCTFNVSPLRCLVETNQPARACQKSNVSKIRDIRQILGVEAADYWGPAAQSALDLLIHSVQGPITVESGEVDERSEQNIKTLHRKVQPLARELIVVAAKPWNSH
jgi:archaellum component FlaC